MNFTIDGNSAYDFEFWQCYIVATKRHAVKVKFASVHGNVSKSFWLIKPRNKRFYSGYYDGHRIQLWK